MVKKKRRSNARLPHWPGGKGYAEEVAGTSHYQDTTETLCDWGDAEGDLFGFAVLEPDPANAYDGDAVRVVFDGKLIGHLSRESAKKYKAAVTDSPEVYDPPTTTAYVRLSRRLSTREDSAGVAIFSASLDMRFDAPPSDLAKYRPAISEPSLMPRLKDFWYIEGDRLVILAFDLDGRTVDLCIPGSGFSIWQPPESDRVFVYADGAIGGGGLVMRTTTQALKRAGFSSVADFDPRIHLTGAGMVVASAKLPAPTPS